MGFFLLNLRAVSQPGAFGSLQQRASLAHRDDHILRAHLAEFGSGGGNFSGVIHWQTSQRMSFFGIGFDQDKAFQHSQAAGLRQSYPEWLALHAC